MGADGIISDVSRREHRADPGLSPTHRLNVADRARELHAAFRVETRSRFEIITSLCRDKLVLDVGCIGQFRHQDLGPNSPGWLHGQVAAVAARCIGVDVDEQGIEELQRAGFEAMTLDVTADLGPLLELAPFDVVVAGEVIEHMDNPGGLVAAASRLLRPGGVLAVTTPNPYAPWRAYAGMRRQTWENVDHVVLMFPSGMAELAHRHGMRLEEATTLGGYRSFLTLRGSVRVAAGQIARRLLGRPHGVAGYVNPVEALFLRRLRKLGQLNDTALYVLRRV